MSAKNAHGIHSPFVFDLYNKVIRKKEAYYSFAPIEARRKELLKDSSEISIRDLGAGSKTLKSDNRKICDIAKYSVKPEKYSRLIFRLVEHFKPKVILELGTSLGITTSYLSNAAPKAKIITIEGCPSIASVARHTLAGVCCGNVELVVGNFDEVLPSVVRHHKKIDFVFIDGNHRFEPTLKYFICVFDKCHEDSVIIIDDIHWSHEMEEAWRAIKKHPSVTITIDLFHMGLVFFKKDQAREHFILRF